MTDSPTITTGQPHGPLQPSATIPNLLHRGTDSWVPLARKVNGQWQELASVPAADLCGLFADEVFAEIVQADGYFGLHGMYCHGRYRSKHTLPGLQPSLRNTNSVRYLTCCHVDLDGYKHGLDTHGIVAAVMRLVDEGTLPPPSLFTLSRGVWAVWRLRDREKVGEPLRTYPESVMRRWCRLQGALTRVCAAIGSDAAATHAATLTRIPGSLNSKNGRRVGYMLTADTHGEPISYTLDELEAFMRPHVPVVVDTVAHRPRSQNPVLADRGMRGWRGRWRHVLQALGQLRDLRGGWKVGTRHMALFYVAMALRALAASPQVVQATMAEHLTWMEQPTADGLQMVDAMRIYRAHKRLKDRGVSLQTLANTLDVSPSEATLLSTTRTRPFPAASRHGLLALPTPPPLPREFARTRRRAVVREICQTLLAKDLAPDGPTVEAHLLAYGITAARATILADMRAVGAPSRRARTPTAAKGRSTAEAQAKLFAASSDTVAC